jgi:hypothetical protein
MKHEPNIFCHALPPDWEDGHAIKLHISKPKLDELANIPKGEENILRGIVAFDSISRKYWAIRHFPCFVDSFECCCAAQAAQVDGPDSNFEWPPVEFPEEEDDECPCCGRR